MKKVAILQLRVIASKAWQSILKKNGSPRHFTPRDDGEENYPAILREDFTSTLTNFLRATTLLIPLIMSWVTIASQPVKICISQVVDHPALNETIRGIRATLTEAGYKTASIRVESAQGNAALASQIASKFIAQRPTLLVGVGTFSAQSLVRAAQPHRIPVVFSSITDPLGAGLITSLEKSRGFVSGVSNFVPLVPQLELFQRLQPDLKRLGILYNPGEMICPKIVAELEVLCPKRGMRLVKQVLTKTADVAQQTTKLAGQVDAIFISNDNTALSCLPSIIKIARAHKIPVYVSDTDAVTLGALAALGPNQYQVGRQTGALMVKVLQGKTIGEIPVAFPQETALFINQETAGVLNIEIPQDLKKKATLVGRGLS